MGNIARAYLLVNSTRCVAVGLNIEVSCGSRDGGRGMLMAKLRQRR
jgi:hypothetical protein